MFALASSIAFICISNWTNEWTYIHIISHDFSNISVYTVFILIQVIVMSSWAYSRLNMGIFASQISIQMDHLSLLTSNALVLANHIPNNNKQRQLASHLGAQHPKMISTKDRRLLQSDDMWSLLTAGYTRRSWVWPTIMSCWLATAVITRSSSVGGGSSMPGSATVGMDHLH